MENKLYKNLPDTPGVYLMKSPRDKILYVGKAGNLRRRVSSYFLRPHDSRIEKLVSEIKKIDYKKTDSALEALILEAELIKKYQPPYNIKEKDDKSFLYVEITLEKFPRVLLVRGKTLKTIYGPFTSASQIREALRIIRKIFPFSVHPEKGVGLPRTLSDRKQVRGCFDYQIGLCPGTCIGGINRADYLKNIRNIKLLFQGKKARIIKNLEREMKAAARAQEFEIAAKLRGKIFALKHIQDTALISDSTLPTTHYKLQTRIEGYDISNISGDYAVGSMVVFLGDKPARNQYKKFKIKTIHQSDDVGMIKEVLRRRMSHREWGTPDIILIDGGKGQVNGAKAILEEFGIKIPVIGIAKGAKRKKNEFISVVPTSVDKKTLIRVRDEAHRFAVGYHKALRSRGFIK
ncbi:MAG: GIY-YIG nuclease family protein [Candidatus Colwellbacteria bacterium]|nr:GIY-YIG nuclease family protein [Candidatus Colwellbacteria bacterium]